MAQMEKYNMTAAMGVIAHAERTGHTHSNENIDPERTHLNYSLWPADQPDAVGRSCAYARLRDRLKSLSYLHRSDVNVLCSWCIYLGVDTLPGYDNEKQFFEACVKYICDRYGAENVMYAWVHMDEKTPHIHIGFVPVVKKKLKLRKNASKKTQEEYAAALAEGKTHVDRVDADSVITQRHLQGWHPAFQKSMIEQLGYDPGVHTGITEALGGSLTVKQLKRKPADWSEKRNKHAEAFHAARRAAQKGQPVKLADRLTLNGLKPQASPAEAPSVPKDFSALLSNAKDRSGNGR